MVQSEFPRGKSYLNRNRSQFVVQRLKSSCSSSSSLRKKSSRDEQTIRVVQGTTATQGKRIPTLSLQSLYSTISFSIPTEIPLKIDDQQNRSSNEDFHSNSYQSLLTTTTTLTHRKDETNERRNSWTTVDSDRVNLNVRPPSSPVDRRCDRAFSSISHPINRETCSLLGPDLCSDCLEIRTRSTLSSESLPSSLVRERLSRLAMRRLVPNDENLSDDQFIQRISSQQIQIKEKKFHQISMKIPSDEEYFQELTTNLNEQSSNHQKDFYFQDLKDLARKYQNDRYPKIFLCDNPSVSSANPVFCQSQFEKFDISSRYSNMKKGSTKRYQLRLNVPTFVSPRKSEEFYDKHRFLSNSSPPLLLQALQQTSRNRSNPHVLHLNNQQFSSSLQNPRHKNKSLIASKILQ